MRYIESGRIDQAFHCVFKLGNERTLCAVLCRLDPTNAWQNLPEAETRYLTHLLVKLLCKDIGAAAAHKALAWLDILLRLPGGAGLLAAEDLPTLQGALFSMSGAAGDIGVCATSVYYRL